MSNTFVVQLDLTKAEALKQGLLAQGFELSTPAYTLFQGKKKGVSCTLYTSGKLTVQGKEMKEFIEYFLEPEILGTFAFGYDTKECNKTPRIGVDESGKGDFFGPLCVAGVFANEESIEKLLKIGVKDSKLLSDQTILKQAKEIGKICEFHVVRLFPRKYNELYEKFGNLNSLLAWGHATVIDVLIEKTKCENVIIDQFAAEHVVIKALKQKKREAILTQKTKGEEDIVVAAASILARAAFIDGIDKLEKEYNHTLPKGASSATLVAGKSLVARDGKEVLTSVAKIHFKTYSQLI